MKNKVFADRCHSTTACFGCTSLYPAVRRVGFFCDQRGGGFALSGTGARLNTYSFEYEGNKENFHSSLFQPQSDDAYALYMAEWLGTEHHVLTAPTEEVAGLLGAAALARDFPGQADIDSSLLYYCRLIKERHTVAMSGECADEIFGGYPWFYRPEMLNSGFFPGFMIRCCGRRYLMTGLSGAKRAVNICGSNTEGVWQTVRFWRRTPIRCGPADVLHGCRSTILWHLCWNGKTG